MKKCTCAIHQPHFFPWMGYLNKIASVEKFIIMDCAQLEKGSNMYRNRLVTNTGVEKYFTVAYEKKGCLDKPFNKICIDNTVNWQEKQKNFIINNYKKKKYFEEIWDKIEKIFNDKYTFLNDVALASVNIELNLFNIKTPIIYQSDLRYNSDLRKNELLIDLCKQIDSNRYLSGNGARKYLEPDLFTKQNIEVNYQRFIYPTYDQGMSFVPNLSALDILFNCGIEESRRIFWNTVNDDYFKER